MYFNHLAYHGQSPTTVAQHLETTPGVYKAVVTEDPYAKGPKISIHHWGGNLELVYLLAVDVLPAGVEFEITRHRARWWHKLGARLRKLFNG